MFQALTVLLLQRSTKGQQAILADGWLTIRLLLLRLLLPVRLVLRLLLLVPLLLLLHSFSAEDLRAVAEDERIVAEVTGMPLTAAEREEGLFFHINDARYGRTIPQVRATLNFAPKRAGNENKLRCLDWYFEAPAVNEKKEKGGGGGGGGEGQSGGGGGGSKASHTSTSTSSSSAAARRSPTHATSPHHTIINHANNTDNNNTDSNTDDNRTTSSNTTTLQDDNH